MAQAVTAIGRAVVLKGPHSDSRSYVTALPDTLEQLVSKARERFPVPPDHTPHITLGDDTGAILLPDAMPFIRDRELLVFRWIADTPRSSLKAARMSEHGSGSSSGSSSSSSSSSSTSVGGSGGGSGSSRSVRWDANVVSNEGKTTSHHARPPSAFQGAAARAAHTAKVLQREQQRRLAEEQEAARSKPNNSTMTTTTAETATTMMRPDGHESDVFGRTRPGPPRSLQPAAEEEEQHHSDSAVELCTPSPAQRQQKKTAEEEQQRQQQQQQQQQQQSSASKLRQMTQGHQEDIGAAQDSRASHPAETKYPEEEQPSSSPIASPTRDVLGARRSPLNELWSQGAWKDLGSGPSQTAKSVHLPFEQPIEDAQAAEVEGRQTAVSDEPDKEAKNLFESVEASKELPPAAITTAVLEQDRETVQTVSMSKPEITVSDSMETESDEEEAVERSISSSNSSPVKEATLNKEQEQEQQESVTMTVAATKEKEEAPKATNQEWCKMMRVVVDQLQGHPSNGTLRRSMSAQFKDYYRQIGNARPADFSTISQRIDAGSYSQKDPLTDFATDLVQMWSAVRGFYGPRSPEARCADELERFSMMLLDEFKRGASRSKQHDRTNEKMDARARAVMTLKQMRSGGSPGSRNEKRPASSMAGQGQFNGPQKRTAEERQKYYANLIRMGITNKDASKAFGDRLEQQEQLRKRPKLDATMRRGSGQQEQPRTEVVTVSNISPTTIQEAVPAAPAQEERQEERQEEMPEQDAEMSMVVEQRTEPEKDKVHEVVSLPDFIPLAEEESAEMEHTGPTAHVENTSRASEDKKSSGTPQKTQADVSPSNSASSKGSRRKKATSPRTSNRGRATKRQTRSAVKA